MTYQAAVDPTSGLSYFTEITLHNGSPLINLHSPTVCAGNPCVLHNPSDHPLMAAPMNFDTSDRIMLRVCGCGVEHPDPDAVAYEVDRRYPVVLPGTKVHNKALKAVRKDEFRYLMAHACCPRQCCVD